MYLALEWNSITPREVLDLAIVGGEEFVELFAASLTHVRVEVADHLEDVFLVVNPPLVVVLVVVGCLFIRTTQATDTHDFIDSFHDITVSHVDAKLPAVRLATTLVEAAFSLKETSSPFNGLQPN